MTVPDMKKLSEVFPAFVSKYETFTLDDDSNTLNKMNDLVQQMNRVGRVSNETVKQWNEVMAWVLDEGVNEATLAEIQKKFDDGTFEQLISDSLETFKEETNEHLLQNAKKTVWVSIEEYDHLITNKNSPKNEWDWTQAINQAILDVYLNGGGGVFFPPNTLKHTGIIMKPYVSLFAFDKEKTILLNTGTGTCLKMVGNATEYMRNTTISNITFRGNVSSGIGIEMAYCTRNKFINVKSDYHGLDGVHIGYSWIIDFITCEIQYNKRDGVRFDKSLNAATETADQNAIIFHGGFIEFNSFIGLNAIDGRGNSIIGMTIEGNGSEGIVLTRVYSFTIEGVYFESNGVNNKKNTVTINDKGDGDGFGATIKGCFIQGSNLTGADATCGINIVSGFNTKIEDCSFSNNKKASIEIGSNAKLTHIGNFYTSDPVQVINNSINSFIMRRPSGQNIRIEGGDIDIFGSIYLNGTTQMIQGQSSVNPLYIRSGKSGVGSSIVFDTKDSLGNFKTRGNFDSGKDNGEFFLRNNSTLRLEKITSSLPTPGTSNEGSIFYADDGTGERKLHVIEYTNGVIETYTLDRVRKVSALPAPSAAYRGKMVRIEGGTGVADSVHMCTKNADDGYTWKTVGLS